MSPVLFYVPACRQLRRMVRLQIIGVNRFMSLTQFFEIDELYEVIYKREIILLGNTPI